MATKEKIIEYLNGILGIPFEEVDSSNLFIQGYDEKSRILYLVFRTRKEGDIPKWVYQYKINPIVYKNFLNAESKGAYFSEFIKEYALCKSPLNL